MIADYRRLGSLAKVAALHGRTRQTVWDILHRRGATQPRPPSRRVIEHGGRKFALDHRGQYRLTQRAGAREVYLHRVLWTEAHGAVPAGHEIVFADGDRTNFALANLVCQPPASAGRAASAAKYGDAHPGRFTSESWSALAPSIRAERLEKLREIQAAHLAAKSRAQIAALLTKNQEPRTKNTYGLLQHLKDR